MEKEAKQDYWKTAKPFRPFKHQLAMKLEHNGTLMFLYYETHVLASAISGLQTAAAGIVSFFTPW